MRREEERREESRQLKETLEHQMDELKEREADVICYLVSYYLCHQPLMSVPFLMGILLVKLNLMVLSPLLLSVLLEGFCG